MAFDAASLLGAGAAASGSGFRPSFSVAPFAASAAAGGGLLEQAVSLLSAPARDPWQDHVRAIEVVQVAAPELARCRITLAAGPEAPSVSVGDALTVSLGLAAAPSAVFSGPVCSVRYSGRGQRELVLASAAYPLARTRENASFEQRSFSDLVQLWASEAGITPGQVESGASYPQLAIDDRRSRWDWLAFMAAHAKCVVFVDGSGALTCAPADGAAGPAARSFSYGSDVLSLVCEQHDAALGEVSVVGEGAAGTQGESAWGWLVKQADGIRSSSGSGDPKHLYADGSLRSYSAVQASAEARASAAATMRVRVSVPGSPELGIATRFSLSDCPESACNGDYVVQRCVHRYAGRNGFTSELHGVRA